MRLTGHRPLTVRAWTRPRTASTSRRSKPGEGATFSFEVSLPTTTPPDVSEEAETLVVPPESIEPCRLLVVDDNQVNLTMTRHMLRSLGHHVECATNGLEALEAVQREAFDAVFLDCAMPVMDGYEACREIRGLEGERSRVPIIAFTANVMPEDRERCRAAGMDDFVSKPVRLTELQAVLERCDVTPAA